MTAAHTTDPGEAFEVPAGIDPALRLALSEMRCRMLEQHIAELKAFIEELKAVVEHQDRQAEEVLARLTAMTGIAGDAHVEH